MSDKNKRLCANFKTKSYIEREDAYVEACFQPKTWHNDAEVEITCYYPNGYDEHHDSTVTIPCDKTGEQFLRDLIAVAQAALDVIEPKN